MIRIPRLYPILDAGLLRQAGIPLEKFARELHDAGIRFLQFRDKHGLDSEVLDQAALLRAIFPRPDCCLILNDRVSLVSKALFDGVHVGQEDLSPSDARAILGPDALIGLSTHSLDQLHGANNGEADYMAFGPVFPTASKDKPDPTVGLDGVRAARSIAHKPLVAIGGITRANCSAVFEAGVDSIAVISDLLPRAGEPVWKRVQELLLL